MDSLLLLKTLNLFKSVMKTLATSVQIYKTSQISEITSTYLFARDLTGIPRFLETIEKTKN